MNEKPKIVGYRIRAEGPGRRWMLIDVVDWEQVREAVETGYRNNFKWVYVVPILQGMRNKL
jgi:hypothetical protein